MTILYFMVWYHTIPYHTGTILVVVLSLHIIISRVVHTCEHHGRKKEEKRPMWPLGAKKKVDDDDDDSMNRDSNSGLGRRHRWQNGLSRLPRFEREKV